MPAYNLREETYGMEDLIGGPTAYRHATGKGFEYNMWDSLAFYTKIMGGHDELVVEFVVDMWSNGNIVLEQSHSGGLLIGAFRWLQDKRLGAIGLLDFMRGMHFAKKCYKEPVSINKKTFPKHHDARVAHVMNWVTLEDIGASLMFTPAAADQSELIMATRRREPQAGDEIGLQKLIQGN